MHATGLRIFFAGSDTGINKGSSVLRNMFLPELSTLLDVYLIRLIL